MKVGIIMGSDSDLSVMKKAVAILKKFGISYEVTVASAHRTPDEVRSFVARMEQEGASAIIAGAGAAAHLPGVVASLTILPVIGVPINGTALQGVDALYAIVQMPSGIPVATMAIDGAKNAALLAVQIGATSDEKLRALYQQYRQELAEEVRKKNNRVQELLASE